MNIDSLDFVRKPKYRGYLEIRDQELYGLSGVKKNDMQSLRYSSSGLLRQEGTARPGFILWGNSYLSGVGDPAGIVPEMRESESGGTEVVVEKSFLHEAVCFLRGPEMSCDDHSGFGQGIEVGLGDSKDLREGIYAGATAAESGCSSLGDRDR